MHHVKLGFVSLAVLALAACGGKEEAKTDPSTNVTKEEPTKATPNKKEVAKQDKLEKFKEILKSDHRTAEERARDQHRHPKGTLKFFGIEEDMTVVEIWPGGGYYTKIIAPYLKQGNGTYIAAGFNPKSESDFVKNSLAAFKETYIENPDVYGNVELTAFTGTGDYKIAEDGSADMVLTFRNVHNWMGGEWEDNAFEQFFVALKPGGILGVVEHRMPTEDADGNPIEQDPRSRNGYVQQDYVIAMAERAGFELVGKAEINANPKDTADHPFGVWTLAPVKRSAARGEEMAPDFDRAKYDAIGESDRMTLRFMKPTDVTGALDE